MLVLGAQVCVRLGPEASVGLGVMCGVGLGAMHRAWVSVGGWVSGPCVGLGRGQGLCAWLWLGATRGGQGWGGQQCRQQQEAQLGSQSHTCVRGSFRAQPEAWLSLAWVLAAGALRLNQAALAQASGRQLRLLPQQRYLRTERAEVSALERKRNVLCCLITRILKVEKQLHIDNLVFRVRGGAEEPRGCVGAAATAVGLPCCRR